MTTLQLSAKCYCQLTAVTAITFFLTTWRAQLVQWSYTTFHQLPDPYPLWLYNFIHFPALKPHLLKPNQHAHHYSKGRQHQEPPLVSCWPLRNEDLMLMAPLLLTWFWERTDEFNISTMFSTQHLFAIKYKVVWSYKEPTISNKYTHRRILWWMLDCPSQELPTSQPSSL